ncbi:MAG TPA: methionyl-tRNA formyltransferase [Gaiella sp.]|nr:methionyl-tRNA formyltransferase [Gaiella sp.]
MARVAVAATAPFGAEVLERLAAKHEVAALLTRPDAPAGRGRRVVAPPAKRVAERLGIPVLQPERPAAGLDVGAPTVVVCAYGLLVPEPLLAERSWLNVHPSLLPRWRGAAPVERAIMAGDAETGVTIHETVAELDAGPVAAQEGFPIGPEDDAGAVYAHSAEVAARLLDAVLAEPDPMLAPQAGTPTYADKISPEDRRLDLTRPADELVRVVRALSPHIGARAELEGRPVTVWHARVAEDGSFEALEVQPDGSRRMSVDAWRRGLR